MPPNVYYIFLVGTFLISGSIYTLSIKWADQLTACGVEEECDNPHKFNHPFVQAVAMFLGEFLCLIGYYCWMCVRHPHSCHRQSHFPSRHCLLFLFPALLDMVATACAYTGLNLTFASSFEMLKGSLVIFTALLSVAFLHRSTTRYEWTGIALVTFGLIVVGVGDFLFSGDSGSQSSPNSIIAGDLLIIIAQIANAAQFVSEEHFMRKYNIQPPLVVGLEGFFGSIILGVLLIPMYFMTGLKPFTSDTKHLEDTLDALAQIRNNLHILIAILGVIVSIAVFNLCGVSITKEASATTRQVADVGRTLIVWAVSLSIGWQPHTLSSILMQSAGFLLLVNGMFLYNNIIIWPLLVRTKLCQFTHDNNDAASTPLIAAADCLIPLPAASHDSR